MAAKTITRVPDTHPARRTRDRLTWEERRRARLMREDAARSRPFNVSNPRLAAAQLKRLDERLGKGVGADSERDWLMPVAARLNLQKKAA